MIRTIKLLGRDYVLRDATKEELQAQHRSWVAGEATWGSDKDEAEYRQAYERGDIDTMKRLDERRRETSSTSTQVYEGTRTMKYLPSITLAAALFINITNANAQTTTPPSPPSSLGLATIGIKITNITGKARDWVGLFPHGAANTAYTDWTYIACDAKTCANTVSKKGSTVTVHFNVPSNLAQADIRYMSLDANNVFQVVTEIDPDLSLH